MVDMCLGTTESCAGIKQGSAFRLGKQVSYSLFGLAVGIIFLSITWANEVVCGAPKPGGEDPLSKRFKDYFDFIDLND